MKTRMIRRRVNGEFGGWTEWTEETCPFAAVVEGCALGFVAHLMGGGGEACFDGATAYFDGVLGSKSGAKFQ